MLPRPTAEPVAASTKPIRDDHWLCACFAMSAFPAESGCDGGVRPRGGGAAGGGVRVHAGLLGSFHARGVWREKARILNVRGLPPKRGCLRRDVCGSVPTPFVVAGRLGPDGAHRTT